MIFVINICERLIISLIVDLGCLSLNVFLSEKHKCLIMGYSIAKKIFVKSQEYLDTTAHYSCIKL